MDEHSAADNPSRLPGSTRGSPTPEGISPLVGEIRAQLREIASRELTVQQREQEMSRQTRLWQQEAQRLAQSEWEEAHRKLAARASELDQQALDLASRRESLEALGERLKAREEQLQKAQGELTESAERLRRGTELERERRKEERDHLRARIGLIRQREQDLEKRIQAARNDIVRQRQELDELRNTLETRATELDHAFGELEARRHKLIQEKAELQERVAALAARDSALVEQKRILEERGGQLLNKQNELQREQDEVSARRAELDQQWREFRGHRQQQSKRIEEWEAQRRTLMQQQSELKTQRRQIAQQQQQLQSRVAAFEQEQKAFESEKAAFRKREAELQDNLRAAGRAERELEQQREDVMRQMETAEAREAESRQTALEIELERQEHERERLNLQLAHEDVDAQSVQHMRELERLRRELAARDAAPRRSGADRVVASRRWWLRTGLLAACMGILAGVGWMVYERPSYEAQATLAVAGSASPGLATLSAHVTALRELSVGEALPVPAGVGASWDGARADGRLRVGLDSESGVVSVALAGLDSESVRTTLERVLEEYASSSVIDVGLGADPDAVRQGLRDERDGLLVRQQSLRDREAVLMARINSLPTAAERVEARRVVESLQEEQRALGERLRTARAELAALTAAPAPRGQVDRKALEEALGEDTVYAEDQQEFKAASLEYRSELAVAMLMLVDPLRDTERVLEDFERVLAEQVSLKPPPVVRETIEGLAEQVGTWLGRVRESEQAWNKRLDVVQHIDPASEAVELVKQQQRAASEAADWAGWLRQASGAVDARLAQLDEALDGSTREVVVATVLRSHASSLRGVVEGVVEAAAQMDLANNVQLDALERRMRGIRTALARREEAIRGALQLAADQRAQAALSERIERERQTVRQLESSREENVSRVAEALDLVAAIDEQLSERRRLSAEAEELGLEVDRAARELEAIEIRLGEAEAGSAWGPSLEVGAARVVQVAGADRWRNAAAAAGVVFVFTVLVAMLLLTPNPFGLGGRPQGSVS